MKINSKYPAQICLTNGNVLDVEVSVPKRDFDWQERIDLEEKVFEIIRKGYIRRLEDNRFKVYSPMHIESIIYNAYPDDTITKACQSSYPPSYAALPIEDNWLIFMEGLMLHLTDIKKSFDTNTNSYIFSAQTNLVKLELTEDALKKELNSPCVTKFNDIIGGMKPSLLRKCRICKLCYSDGEISFRMLKEEAERTESAGYKSGSEEYEFLRNKYLRDELEERHK